MSFKTPWINSYKSIINLSQDPISGQLTGTYRSTTGGTGTYDVIGWASLNDPDNRAGQAMAISILWRSNDGGISDPSHEVSGMAGQVVALIPEENIVVIHVFVETDPGSGMQLGFYPDKLTFIPTKSMFSHDNISTLPANESNPKDTFSGIWVGQVNGVIIEIALQLCKPGETRIEGTISYSNSIQYPIVGFTDMFAISAKLNMQGISFSTYIDEPHGRTFIAMAGYLNLTTNKVTLIQLSAQSTKPDATWQQVIMEKWDLERKVELA